jgi:hypothetical protein
MEIHSGTFNILEKVHFIVIKLSIMKLAYKLEQAQI